MLGALLPWFPFVVACLSRLAAGLSAALWLERHVVGVAPEALRSLAFYSAVALIGQAVVRTVLSALFAGPTPDTRVTTESGTFLAGSVAWVAAGMRGWREQMEDAHVAELLEPSVFEDTALFAVLDGHGGKDVSALASKLLARTVVACGRAQRRLNGRAREGNGAAAAPDLQQALEAALPRLDLRLRSGCLGLGLAVPGLAHPFSTVGCTACVVAVDLRRREVVCANIGDSRAMLIRNGKALALSEDHKPENPGERARINSAGGRVIKVGPCHRVDGNLNLSRALGDFYLKGNAALPPEKQKVIAVPDSMRSGFSGGSGELLVVACDGLFEKRSNQDIANLIWPRYKSGVPLEQIAQEVLLACCARGRGGHPIEEGTDNESVILVRLPAAADGAEPAAASPAASDGDERRGSPAADDGALRPGRRVEIHGLASEAGQRLNGLQGTVAGECASNGRYPVRLAGSGELKSITGEHLKAV